MAFSKVVLYTNCRNQLADDAGVNQSNHLEVAMNRYTTVCSMQQFLVFSVNIECYVLNSRLIKMERQYNVIRRWNPTDQQCISLLIIQEAVNAKQTRDMLLVSGRRRCFFYHWRRNILVIWNCPYPFYTVVNIVNRKQQVTLVVSYHLQLLYVL
jgi:hypothetical protein